MHSLHKIRAGFTENFRTVLQSQKIFFQIPVFCLNQGTGTAVTQQHMLLQTVNKFFFRAHLTINVKVY